MKKGLDDHANKIAKKAQEKIEKATNKYLKDWDELPNRKEQCLDTLTKMVAHKLPFRTQARREKPTIIPGGKRNFERKYAAKIDNLDKVHKNHPKISKTVLEANLLEVYRNMFRELDQKLNLETIRGRLAKVDNWWLPR